MAGDEEAPRSSGRPIPQQMAVLQRQRPGELDGTPPMVDRPQPALATPGGLEKPGSAHPLPRIDRAEAAHRLPADGPCHVVRRSIREPEAPAALCPAGGIERAVDLPDLLAPQDPPEVFVPLGVEPQLAPTEGGERQTELHTPELSRAGAAGIGRLVDVAHQARREPGRAEGGDGKEDQCQSASAQARGRHEIRIRADGGESSPLAGTVRGVCSPWDAFKETQNPMGSEARPWGVRRALPPVDHCEPVRTAVRCSPVEESTWLFPATQQLDRRVLSTRRRT